MSKYLNPPSHSWKKAEQHEAGLIKRMRRAHKGKARKLADQLMRQYLSSYDCRLVAARNAVRGMKLRNRPNATAIPGIAMEADPWVGTDEPVNLSFKPKASNANEFRPIMDFGPVNRTLQTLARSVLAARSDILDCQFALKGHQVAVKAAANALLSGHEYVVEVDIRNCYPSFHEDAVPNLLPLPKEVTRKVILAHSLNLSLNNDNLKYLFGTGESEGEPSLDETFPDDLAEARRGIPQGASTSPLSVEIMLASVLDQLPPWVTVVNYADNILVAGGDENGVASAVDILRGALQAHPAGPLLPKAPNCYYPGDTVRFLGFELKKVGDDVWIEPSAENAHGFKAEFSRRLKRACRQNIEEGVRKKAFADCNRYVLSWWASFGVCSNANERRAECLSKLHCAAGQFGIAL